MIIIGAHYDHLGHGDFGSTAPDQKNAIHNGADDNASGVAALIETARRLSRVRLLARSILFIAFTGEESGLLGSGHFAANPSFALSDARAMLNMDMVGRLGAGPLIVYGTGTATEWTKMLDAATSAEQIEYKASPDGYGPSDHTSFYMKDIPVLHFFTNVHSDYHKPSDDWDKIDAAGLDKVISVVTRIAQDLSRPAGVVTLVRGAGRPPGQGGQSTSGYGSYLGTVPDFKPVDRGVLISGASPGSPAEQAGLKGGDIIIKFDDDTIANLQDMTDGLHKRKPGDAVRITVLREGKEVVLNAVLKSRN
jgi:membrane-associated protease RseP (regulator of RpoE activity)